MGALLGERVQGAWTVVTAPQEAMGPRAGWPAQPAERVALDLPALSSSPTLGQRQLKMHSFFKNPELWDSIRLTVCGLAL